MTETGMVLSNQLHGERRAGYVGLPMPGVEVRIARPDAAAALAEPRLVEPPAEPSPAEPPAETSPAEPPAETSPAEPPSPGGMSAAKSPGPCSTSGEAAGELRVRGPALFSGYWSDAAATAAAFDDEGWFRTGDTAETGGRPPLFRILGRASVDILKAGGFKVSALEVEAALLACPGVAETAVVGVPDAVYGQKIAALVVLRAPGGGAAAAAAEDAAAAEAVLRASLAQLLAPYQLPRIIRFLPELPRNAMGKVNKKALLARFFPPPG